MKKIIILVFLLLSYGVQAQISLTPTQSSNLHFSSSDGFDCVISSSLEQPINVFLEMRITAEKGFEVVYARSEKFVLEQGVARINENILRMESKKYLNKDFGAFEQSNGFLPSANYTICLSLKCADEDCLQKMGLLEGGNIEVIACIDKIAINPTPLLLVSPFDEAELKERRPNFSWIPPMPIGADPNLSYRFTLVELKKKQSGESGIRRNRPIYQIEGLKSINLPFPSELEDLKVGTTYAWQVDAILGKTPIQTSDVWEFEIIKEEEEVFPMPFVRLKLTDDQIYNAVNELKFIYNQEGVSERLHYSINSLDGVPLNLNLEGLELNYGENSLKLDLRTLGLEHKGYYVLNVVSDKGELYSLKFRCYFKKELK